MSEFALEFDGEYVFLREVLRPGFRQRGSPVSKALRQFRARFARGETAPLDVTVVGVIERVSILGLVRRGFQREPGLGIPEREQCVLVTRRVLSDSTCQLARL